MKNICILDAQTIGSLANLKPIVDLGNTAVFQQTNVKKRVENIGDANVIVTNKVVIDKHVLDSCPNIELICITATGTNNVDLEYAKIKGVAVRNVAGYSTNSVAQFTFTMLFHLIGKMQYYGGYVASGSYSQSDTFTHIGPEFGELNGKVWGIIGLGAIGRRVAEIASAFGCKVIYYSTSGLNNTSDYDRADLNDLLRESDFISIHSPLNSKTENLIDSSQLSLMKSSAYLINVGRGKIVNEESLAKALSAKKIKGACIDVMEQEPILADSPLMKIQPCPNLLITPHIAWTSVEARKELIRLTADNITEFYSA